MVTVKLWREVNDFNPLHDNNLDVDGTVELIAKVQGKPKEEVEELPIEELLPTFVECVRQVNALVFEKVKQVPKNADGAVD